MTGMQEDLFYLFTSMLTWLIVEARSVSVQSNHGCRPTQIIYNM